MTRTTTLQIKTLYIYRRIGFEWQKHFIEDINEDVDPKTIWMALSKKVK
jgi:hypothetical protein